MLHYKIHLSFSFAWSYLLRPFCEGQWSGAIVCINILSANHCPVYTCLRSANKQAICWRISLFIKMLINCTTVPLNRGCAADIMQTVRGMNNHISFSLLQYASACVKGFLSEHQMTCYNILPAWVKGSLLPLSYLLKRPPSLLSSHNHIQDFSFASPILWNTILDPQSHQTFRLKPSKLDSHLFRKAYNQQYLAVTTLPHKQLLPSLLSHSPFSCRL